MSAAIWIFRRSRLREELVGTGVQVQKVGDNVRLIMPSNITFDTDSAVFKPVFNNILTSVAKVINEFDKTKVQVARLYGQHGAPPITIRCHCSALRRWPII